MNESSHEQSDTGRVSDERPVLPRNFSQIDPADPAWREVLHLAVSRRLKRREVIIHAGEVLSSLYYLAEGELRMDYIHISGQEKTLWYLGPGVIFAETPFLHGQPCRTTFVATRPSLVYGFSRDLLFKTIFPQRPDLLTGLLRTLALKVRLLHEQIVALTLDSLPLSICNYLACHLVREKSGEWVAEVPLNRQELANLFGVHRITLYKALVSLRRSGVLGEFRKGRVRIRDERSFFQMLCGGSNACG